MNRKIFILVPALDHTAPVKGAMAAATGLADSFDITFVVLGKKKTDIAIPANVSFVSLESSGCLLNKYRTYKKILKEAADGPSLPISISFTLPADVINVLQARRAVIFSSLRGNIVRNYAIRWGLLGSLLAFLHIFLFRFFRQILSMSRAMNEVLQGAGIKNITLIGNFVDEAALRPFREAESVTGEAFRFIFLGNLTKLKQPQLLIRAVQELARSGIDFRLWILGEGPLREDLEEMTRNLGLTQKVEFFGFVGQPYSLIQQADCLVLPSLSEGISRAALEALFFGVPCILRDVGAASELIEPGVNGYLFRNDRELVSVMTEMIRTFTPHQPRHKKCLLPSLYRYEEGIQRYSRLIEHFSTEGGH